MPPDIAVDAEPVLREVARNLDTGKLREAARRLRFIADPDGQAGIDARHRENRWLDIATTFNGMIAVTGMLDPETGASLRTALNALDCPVPGDVRTASSRRADALGELARRALDRGELPDVGGERPHLNVTVDYATLLGGAGSAPAELEWAGPIGLESLQRLSCDASVTRILYTTEPRLASRFRAELPPVADPVTPGPLISRAPPAGQGPPGSPDPAGFPDAARSPNPSESLGSSGPSRTPGPLFTPVATCRPGVPPEPGSLFAHGSLASREPLIVPGSLYWQALPPSLRARSLPLDVGRASRLATSAQRKAVVLRDGGCAILGCDRPPSWCDVHHILHWSEGGETCVDNLCLLCRRHHTIVHNEHWLLTLNTDGTLDARPPALAGLELVC